MSNLRRRLRKLEARLAGANGLIPYSQEWFDYYSRIVEKIISGEDPGEPGCIPIAFLDALRARTEQEQDDNVAVPDLFDDPY